MTKTLSPAERRRLVVSLGDFFHEFSIKPAVTGKHAEPFSKREEGKRRRNERRQAIARKHSALS